MNRTATVGKSATQRGNKISLSYRRDSFVRMKKKNQKRIDELMNKEKVIVVFESQVVGIQPGAVQLKVREQPPVSIKNDFVFIFAGGEMPTEFLRKGGKRRINPSGFLSHYDPPTPSPRQPIVLNN
jgi:thioredoxin reductase